MKEEEDEEEEKVEDEDGSCDFRKKLSASLAPSPVFPSLLLCYPFLRSFPSVYQADSTPRSLKGRKTKRAL